ncbi:MAG: DUF1987 domain-containing protein [Bacteroidia bacterium]|nr:DUF1987 domain-containing protein [Bacteroidia bacterium]
MFKLEKTNHTPEIIIEPGLFKMSGICTPENPPKFFMQFHDDLVNSINSSASYELLFHLDYFNTGASKCLLNLFKLINDQVKNPQVKVVWTYEQGDDEMKESGELFAEITELPFEYSEI